MSINRVRMLIAGLVLMGGSSFSQETAVGDLQQQVMDTERAFAQTMAERDFDAFGSFLAGETVFFSGEQPLVGKQAVMDAWRAYYEAESAPFSWAPATVIVLESGTLALSTGPVFDAAGKHVATFSSIWRQESPGVWRIVFDKGCRVCACPQD